MKTFPPGLDALLATGQFEHADLYEFMLQDGTNLYYTTADRDVIYNGNVYTSKGPFFENISSGQSRWHCKAGTDADEWTVKISPAATDPITGVNYPATIYGQPWMVAVRVGALDGAEVRVHRAYWAKWPSWLPPTPPPGTATLHLVGATPGTYTGPGNLVPGATAWWGLRAYSSSTVGTAAIRLRRDGGSPATQDFNTLSNGHLDLTSIIAFKGANNLFVDTLYDQTGNGHHFTQVTLANQPQFLLNVIGTLPAMNFVYASQLYMSCSMSALTVPITMNTVAKRVTGSGDFNGALGSPSAAVIYFDSAAAQFDFYARNSAVAVAETDNAWHSLIGISNGASTVAICDGTSGTPGNPGSPNAPAETDYLGTPSGTIQWMNGNIGEAAIWNTTAFSAAQIAQITANQRSFWGF